MAKQGYVRIAPEFWTGETGRLLRTMGTEVQLVALYLITGPTASPLGLYYLPIPTLCHEVGISTEGALKALRRVSEGGFAYYDAPSETVYVPEMARFQIGETIKPDDNRRVWILSEAEKLKKSPHFSAWFERYREPFSLPDMKPLRSPFEAPSKPTPTPIATTTATTTAPKKPRATWLTPFAAIWKAAYEGDLPFGEAGSVLKKPVADLGSAEVESRLKRYCENVSGQFASITKFASTIGTWKETNGHRPGSGKPQAAGKEGQPINDPEFWEREAERTERENAERRARHVPNAGSDDC